MGWNVKGDNKVARIFTENAYAISILKHKSEESQRTGSAFAINESLLLTSFHIIESEIENKPAEQVKILKDTGYEEYGKVLKYDIPGDLAIIQTEQALPSFRIVKIASEIPDIGATSMWAGYPFVYGEEDSLRLRFARGMVSSDFIPLNTRMFVEIDGIVNYGHSGSGVINCETEELFGIMCGSAGSLKEHLEKSQNIYTALQILQSTWSITETLDHHQSCLEDLAKEINGKLDSGIYLDTYSTRLSVPGKLPNQVLDIFKKLGIDVSIEIRPNLFENKDNIYTVFDASIDELFSSFFSLLNDYTEHTEWGLRSTIQMGIGVASCGNQISEFIA